MNTKDQFFKSLHELDTIPDAVINRDGIIWHWIERKLREQAEDIIALSDKIEMEAGHTELNEWRAFKGFRNTLRDKYLK